VTQCPRLVCHPKTTSVECVRQNIRPNHEAITVRYLVF